MHKPSFACAKRTLDELSEAALRPPSFTAVGFWKGRVGFTPLFHLNLPYEMYALR